MGRLGDLRFIIGLFFTATGLVLLVYAFSVRPQVNAGLAVNEISGAAFAAFGLLMLGFSLADKRQDEFPEE